MDDTTALWIAFVVGAIVAAVIFSLLFDWALIAPTVLSGALLVCDALTLAPATRMFIFAGLVIVGAIVQARTLAPRPEGSASNDRV